MAILWKEYPDAITPMYDAMVPDMASAVFDVLTDTEGGVYDYMTELMKAASFDLSDVNDAGRDWAAKHGARRITDITKQQEAMVRTLTQRAFDDGWTDDELGSALESHIGLDPRLAGAVENYRSGLIKSGKTRAQAARLAEQKSYEYIEYRAQLIAKTEMQDALVAGQRNLWSLALAEGEIDPIRYVIKWATHRDDRRCKVCKSMHGKTTSLIRGTYDVQGPMSEGPTAHPACRCYEVLWDTQRGRTVQLAKSAPRDGDGDGFVNDGPFQRPAAPKIDRRLKAGTELFHGTRNAQSIRATKLRASQKGESGPGVYLTDDKEYADRIATYDERMETLTYKTKRPLKLLDRGTPEGEKKYRDYGFQGPKTQAKMRADGYDGVSYPGVGERSPEIVVFDPDDLDLAPFHSSLGATYDNDAARDAEIELFDALPSTALVRVYHGTSAANASAIKRTKTAGYEPRNDSVSDVSQHKGMYIAPTLRDAQTYTGPGGKVISFTIPKSKIKASPEAGKKSVGKALYFTFEGAVVINGSFLSDITIHES